MNTADTTAVELILSLTKRSNALAHAIDEISIAIVLGDEEGTYKSNAEMNDLRYQEKDLTKRKAGIDLDLNGLKRDLGIYPYHDGTVEVLRPIKATLAPSVPASD